MTDLPPELAPIAAALAGQYAVVRELGRGGMGIVLLARDERLDRPVALKVLPPALAGDPVLRERFLREARMAAQLAHPHIVPIHRADELGGVAFFAMGYVDGPTFGERLRERGTLPAAEVVRTLREAAWALAYAHARGIVHRDVKPDNILVERATGRALVTDFGIARADFNPALTHDGHVLGTVHFMSPEQALGEPLDGRSDLYALGCLGYLALSGRLPFADAAPQAVLVAHATKPAPPLRSVAPDVPAPVAAVIDRCLRKTPAERYATGEALADALQQALEEAARAGGAQDAYVSEAAAMAVWRRAAELQAEAAAQLEQRLRETRDTRALAAANPLAAPGAPPTDSYKLADVQAAAAEAGISAKYVALALAEQRGDAKAVLQATSSAPVWQQRLARRLELVPEHGLSLARTVDAPPATTLQELGRLWQGMPWELSLVDTVGGHPLDGGVLRLAVPKLTGANAAGYKWRHSYYSLHARQLRVTLAPVPGDPRRTQVTVTMDSPVTVGGQVAGFLGAGVGVVSGFGGSAFALGFGALGATGLALAGTVMAGLLLGSGVYVAITPPLKRWSFRLVLGELGALVDALQGALRSVSLFGSAPPPPAPPAAGGNDFLVISS
jgi:predicted Ser/Thr protein kinase